ncbi:MAG: hypothetical protein AAGF90_21680, partial [Pseudomonadota bacterium]
MRGAANIATLFFAGLVSKFVLAGVVMFAAPLILARSGWSADDVGQALMRFAAATLVAAPLSARWADQTGDPGRSLLAGALLSAVGVAALGFAASDGAASLGIVGEAALAAGALVLLGLGQGAAAAPLIAEVARTRPAL